MWYKLQTEHMIDIVCQYDGEIGDLISGKPVTLVTPFQLKFTDVPSTLAGVDAVRRQIDVLPLWNFEREDNEKGELLISSARIFSVDVIPEEDKVIKHAKLMIEQVKKARAEYRENQEKNKSKSENDKVLDKYVK